MIYSVTEIKQKINPIFQSYGVKKAILFGSYAKGTPEDSSDIDIFIDSGLHGLHFFGLLEDVCAVFDKNIDLIDIVDVEAGSRVDKEIKETGVTLYEIS